MVNWVCYQLCRGKHVLLFKIHVQGPNHFVCVNSKLSHVILVTTLIMFITMQTWITFVIHIEGPIRSLYKVLL